MKKNIFCIIILIFNYLPVFSQGIVNIRLSYKVILDPATGNRPAGVTDAGIDAAINEMNALNATYFRGYRFVRVGNIQNVGGLNQTTGPSRWYNTDFFDDKNGTTWKNQMDDEAKNVNNQAAYAWDVNAINIYIVNGFCGGKSSFPPRDIVLIGRCSHNDGPLQEHEIGHYFNLCHTQGCPCGDCDAGKTGVCHTMPGDDEVADTPADLQCWNRDNIAQSVYSRNYSILNLGEQSFVDDSFLNIMSYHNNIVRLTELQLDRWSDAAILNRGQVLDRAVDFVSTSITLLPNGTSALPFNTIAQGTTFIPNNGVLIIKPGAYNETLTISKPLSIRATRAGWVTIGGNAIIGKPNQEKAAMIVDAMEEESLSDSLGVLFNRTRFFCGMDEAPPNNTIESKVNLKIYPNPNEGLFTMTWEKEITTSDSPSELIIFNYLGEIVYQKTVLGDVKAEINLTKLPKGIYYVKLSQGNRQIAFSKIVYN